MPPVKAVHIVAKRVSWRDSGGEHDQQVISECKLVFRRGHLLLVDGMYGLMNVRIL